METIVNADRGVYVFDTERGQVSMGFASAFKETYALAQRLGCPEFSPQLADYGSLSLLTKRDALLKAASKRYLGTWYSLGTPEALQIAIEMVIDAGDRVRVFYGDESGLDWMCGDDVVGIIHRNSGVLRAPLFKTAKEVPGTLLKLKDVVRMICLETGQDLYRHPSYRQQAISILMEDRERAPATVYADGEDEAGRFDTYEEAVKWADFLKGERLTLN